MKKIIKYRIARASNIDDLEFNVNSLIQEGWQPFNNHFWHCFFYQPMVMYAHESNLGWGDTIK